MVHSAWQALASGINPGDLAFIMMPESLGASGRGHCGTVSFSLHRGPSVRARCTAGDSEMLIPSRA
jgi:hypothetical protein